MKNSAIYLFGYAVKSILILVNIPIFTRLYTPADYGALALASVYATLIAGLANFGLSAVFERSFFRIRLSRAYELMIVGMSLSAVVFCILALATASVSDIVGKSLSSLNLGTSILLWTVTSAFLFNMFSGYCLVLLRSQERPIAYNAYSILQAALQIPTSLFLALVLKWGPEALSAGLAISTLVSLVLFLCQEIRWPIRYRLRAIIGSIPLALPLTSRVFVGVLATQLDKLLLGLLGTPANVGIYDLGKKIGEQVFSFQNNLQNVFGPRLFAKLQEQKKADSGGIGAYLLPFLVATLLMALCVIVFVEELIGVLMPPAYHGAIPVSAVLSAYFALLFFGKISGTQLLHAGKTISSSLLTALTVGLNLAFNIPLITLLGPLGAALGTLCASLLATAITVPVAQRVAPIDWPVGKITLLVSAFIGVASVVVCQLMFNVAYFERLMTKAVCLVLFTAVCLFLLPKGFLTLKKRQA